MKQQSHFQSVSSVNEFQFKKLKQGRSSYHIICNLHPVNVGQDKCYFCSEQYSSPREFYMILKWKSAKHIPFNIHYTSSCTQRPSFRFITSDNQDHFLLKSTKGNRECPKLPKIETLQTLLKSRDNKTLHTTEELQIRM